MVRILFQALQANGFQIPIDSRVQLPWSHRVLGAPARENCRIVAEGRNIDLRISSIPTLLGEKIEVPADLVVLATGMVPDAADGEAIRQVAEALDIVHKVGYIHRDVCPRNLLLTGDGETCKLDNVTMNMPLVAARMAMSRFRSSSPNTSSTTHGPSSAAPTTPITGLSFVILSSGSHLLRVH